MDENNQNEVVELLERLGKKHADVIQPLVQRINELTAEHDGDGIYYMHQALATLATEIKKMIKAGQIVVWPDNQAAPDQGKMN